MKSYNVISKTNIKSPITDMYNRLKSNIHYSNPDKNIKVIEVTSTNEGEGKTSTVANLATCYSQTGKKTLIVDLDLRKPKIHKYFGLRNRVGITDYILDDIQFSDIVNKCDEDIYVITAGSKVDFPSKLIESKKIQNALEDFKDNFDIIIIDTPPIGLISDGLGISKLVDGVLFVVASGETRKSQLTNIKQQLDIVNANIIGVVLTKADDSFNNYIYSNYYFTEHDNSD